MKPCPFCGEQIQEVAVKCRYCGEWLDPSRRPEASTRPAFTAEPAPVTPPPPAGMLPLSVEPGHPVEGPRMVGARTELWVPPGRTDLSIGTAGNEPPASELSRLGPPPAWNPPPDGIPADTIRGVPALTLHPAPSPNHIPTLLPEIERRPPDERSDIGAVQVIGRAELPPMNVDVDLDVLPANPPPPPPAPGHVPAAAPPPPPAPPADPTAPFQARSADAFMQAFLGNAEPAPDSGGDDDPFGASNVAPAPPPPWPWIGAVAAVVVAVGLYMFRDRLLGPDEPAPATDVAAEAKAEPPPEPKAPEVKPDPPPETKLAEAAEPKPPPPAPTDPAFVERLARAKTAYSDGKLKAAAAALADLSQQAPEHPEVLLLTAQVQLEEGKMAESRATADKCVAIDPNLADCWLTLGVLRQSGKDDAGAVAAYETYLKLAPAGRYARDANSQLARLKKSSG